MEGLIVLTSWGKATYELNKNQEWRDQTGAAFIVKGLLRDTKLYIIVWIQYNLYESDSNKQLRLHNCYSKY